jgi:CheY-like chemotaxis protein
MRDHRSPPNGVFVLQPQQPQVICMNSDTDKNVGKRVLIVEDEAMIRMLLSDMLDDLGYSVAAEAGRIDEAVAMAKDAAFDFAILDLNLNGQPIAPFVEVLVARGLPFAFASGYGERAVPEAYRGRPMLQKPFQSDALGRLLASLTAKT